MITTRLDNNPLDPSEKKCFQKHLAILGLNENIWDLYKSFQGTASIYTKPILMKLVINDITAMASYMVKCYDYGKTLINSSVFASVVKKLKIPVYVWMRAGIAAESFSNPGFMNLNFDEEGLERFIQKIIKHHFLFIFIHDFAANQKKYPTSIILPYVDEGIVFADAYNTTEDYIAQHKNIRKKIKKYRKTGGIIDIVSGKVDPSDRAEIKKCVESTAEKSVFKLPFQENYAKMCQAAASIENKNIVHFICRIKNQFTGYHTFIRLNHQIRCINGAFNRNLPTTNHAYENMILEVVAYCIQHDISTIYFGPVLNETKRRMMNGFEPTYLYVYSKIPVIQSLASRILKHTNLNRKELLRFANLKTREYAQC
jgi:hypothetical protein